VNLSYLEASKVIILTPLSDRPESRIVHEHTNTATLGALNSTLNDYFTLYGHSTSMTCSPGFSGNENALCHERRPRKGHKKSRQGCLECKRRKIKVFFRCNFFLPIITATSVKRSDQDVTTASDYLFVAVTFQKQPLSPHLCPHIASHLYISPMFSVSQICVCFITFWWLHFLIFQSDQITYGSPTSHPSVIR